MERRDKMENHREKKILKEIERKLSSNYRVVEKEHDMIKIWERSSGKHFKISVKEI
ncbi:hypothetical protein [Eubacterium ramulus]|uniref:hypothetical protein n=1 Tax=Eubacterium ramulus TaxID=39490 RepID=UPI0022E48455|nr:hypothetical protein [Eubacterium ramulus]